MKSRNAKKVGEGRGRQKKAEEGKIRQRDAGVCRATSTCTPAPLTSLAACDMSFHIRHDAHSFINVSLPNAISSGGAEVHGSSKT